MSEEEREEERRERWEETLRDYLNQILHTNSGTKKLNSPMKNLGPCYETKHAI